MPSGEKAVHGDSGTGSHIARAEVIVVVRKLPGGRALGLMTLPHCVDIRDSAVGLADWDGGTCF